MMVGEDSAADMHGLNESLDRFVEWWEGKRRKQSEVRQLEFGVKFQSGSAGMLYPGCRRKDSRVRVRCPSSDVSAVSRASSRWGEVIEAAFS